jgi:hypothetical protein
VAELKKGASKPGRSGDHCLIAYLQRVGTDIKEAPLEATANNIH